MYILGGYMYMPGGYMYIPGGYMYILGGYMYISGGYMYMPGGYMYISGGYMYMPGGYMICRVDTCICRVDTSQVQRFIMRHKIFVPTTYSRVKGIFGLILIIGYYLRCATANCGARNWDTHLRTFVHSRLHSSLSAR